MIESSTDEPLRVVVFFSGSASGLRYLADNDPNYGDEYEVVGGFTDSPDCPGVEHLGSLGIPVETTDIDEFYSERGHEDTTDLDVREEFDARTRELIRDFDPDLVLLSGYMRILTPPLVDAYPVINVHPADLRVEDDDGERVYTGFDPVYDAVEAGEPYTRSSVHLVTTDVDDGPLIVVSRPFEVHHELVETLSEFDADDAFESYVESHQEWMKWEGDGPALAKALELIAEGRVRFEDNEVLIDGDTGPFVMER
ncbi:MAG: formyltransferase family protein [Halobacteria archaeon]|nr:formyltransferase family protein [Halobacteria archaeon]